MPSPGTDFSGLVPPSGATYGTISMTVPWDASASWRGNYNYGGSQNFNGRLNLDFYVYLVDGVTPNYYVVVLVLSGGFSPGQLLQDSNSAEGYFQYEYNLLVQPTSGNDQPFGPTSVEILSEGPSSWTNQVQILVPLEASMILMTYLNSHGSKVPTPFTATLNGVMQLSDWGVNDITNNSSGQAGWYFYQVNPWPANLWNNFAQHVIAFTGIDASTADSLFASGNVNPVSQLGKTNFPFVAACAWQFDSALISNGSLPVLFSGSTYSSQLMLGTQDDVYGKGCYGCTQTTYSTPLTWSLQMDLVQVANGNADGVRSSPTTTLPRRAR